MDVFGMAVDGIAGCLSPVPHFGLRKSARIKRGTEQWEESFALGDGALFGFGSTLLEVRIGSQQS